MFSFLICLALLVLGYLFYGKFVEKVFNPDPNRTTPAIAMQDGVDYVPMPAWKIYMIQFLNIAGTGPIFGAIMGAKFGPASYLWIVFGCIFAGAVHDYLSGMLSLHHDGALLPDVVERYTGKSVKAILSVYITVLLILVGTVFIYSPAQILGDMTSGISNSHMIWVGVIFAYYILATMLPVDKIIGKIYPVFAISLLFMAIALLIGLFIKWPTIPEFWDGLANRSASVGVKGQSIFPCMFITIACGAISGFHATQSPMMARCMQNEKLGRPIFYGSMITEGIVALIWAAVSSYFFFDGGAEEVGSSLTANAPQVVNSVAKSWLGLAGSVLALLGVVAAPITSGDTAFRSARLLIAEIFHIKQSKNTSRLAIVIPLFMIAAMLLWYNIASPEGFNNIWKYFGWANQTLSVFTLWAISAYLYKTKKNNRWVFLIAFIPTIFMAVVCTSFIATQKIGFGLAETWIPCISAVVVVACIAGFYASTVRGEKKVK